MQAVNTLRGYHFGRHHRSEEEDDYDDDGYDSHDVDTSNSTNNDYYASLSSDNIFRNVAASLNSVRDSAAAGIDTSARSILSTSSATTSKTTKNDGDDIVGCGGGGEGGEGVPCRSPRRGSSSRRTARTARRNNNHRMSQTAEEIFVSNKAIISDYFGTSNVDLDASAKSIAGGGIGGDGGTATAEANNNNGCDFTTCTKKVGGIIDGREVIFELREAINDKPKISKSQREDDDSTHAECINVKQSRWDLRCKWYLLQFHVPQLTLGYIACVLLLNFVFASLWYSIHHQSDGAKCCDDPEQTFLEVFDFAIQTSFTIGKVVSYIYIYIYDYCAPWSLSRKIRMTHIHFSTISIPLKFSFFCFS